MNKKISLITAAALSLLLAGCQSTASTNTADTSSKTAAVDTQTSNTKESGARYGTYDEEDLKESTDESATTIKLNDKSAEIDGSGAAESNGVITISEGGTYKLSGEYQGQIKVNAAQGTVRLLLENATIKNSDSSAIYVEQAKKTIITLADGSTNTVTDGENYTFASAEENEPDAALFSKDDLVINGGGTLNVEGNYSNGIRGKDDVTITDGILNVKAKNNGIKAKDTLNILAGTFKIETSEGDGLQANGTETGTGVINLDGGTFTITSGRDGVQAESDLNISQTALEIKTGDGAGTENVDTNESYKGLKAGNAVTIDNGTFTFDTADDGIHSNNDITINGGKFAISSYDDGIHADNNLTLNNGEINVAKSYEGLEASVITINDGTHTINASDDGINAGGGSDTETTTDTGRQQDQFGGPGGSGGPGGESADESKQIFINGGQTTVIAQGDGVDSNGNIEMKNGTLIIDGPSSGGNGVLDYGGSFKLTGGTLLGVGTADMAQTASDTSTQYSLAVGLDSAKPAGTTITVSTDDKEVIRYTSKNPIAYVVTSSPDMKDGSKVTLSYSDNETDDYTLSDVVTSENVSSGMGMGGGPGPENDR